MAGGARAALSTIEQLKRWQASGNAAKRGIYHVAKILWGSWQFAANADRRSRTLTAWRFRGRYFQQSTHTVANRYPELFAQCRDYLAHHSEPRLLSFGCATGEEVRSLGEYLPHAWLVGVDINAWCIEQCRKHNQSSRMSFVQRTAPEFSTLGDFDAIFCMAVFQRTENRTHRKRSTAAGFTFEQFEGELSMLDSKLKPGGLLFIEHSDFDFLDATCSKLYEALPFEGNRNEQDRPLYNRQNQKVADTQSLYRCFVKRR